MDLTLPGGKSSFANLQKLRKIFPISSKNENEKFAEVGSRIVSF